MVTETHDPMLGCLPTAVLTSITSILYILKLITVGLVQQVCTIRRHSGRSRLSCSSALCGEILIKTSQMSCHRQCSLPVYTMLHLGETSVDLVYAQRLPK